MSVRAHFENRAKPTSRTNTNTTTEDRVAIQEKLETTTSLDMTEIDAALDRITTMIDTVSDLQSEYLAKISSGVSRKNPQGLTDAIKHVTELERLHEAIGEPKPRDIYRSPPEEEETSVLDEALEQVVPEEAFTESKRQKALTEEEGRIISSFLARRGADVNVDPTSEVEEIFTPDQTPPMTRLEGLIESTPEMKAVYQRALNMPTSSDHDACRDLVIKMGVPVLEARIPYEAEGLAASLTNAGLVDFVGTEDSDVIAYGVSRREVKRSKLKIGTTTTQRLELRPASHPRLWLKAKDNDNPHVIFIPRLLYPVWYRRLTPYTLHRPQASVQAHHEIRFNRSNPHSRQIPRQA